MNLCDNCGWKGEDLNHRFPLIPGLLDRIDPGGVVPSGVCPNCGALCYPIKPADTGIYEYLDISTAHITEADHELLTSGETGVDHSVIVESYNGPAFWVFVDDEHEVKDRLLEDGFSAAFIKIFMFAQSRKIWWIRFDDDGVVHEQFAKFDW